MTVAKVELPFFDNPSWIPSRPTPISRANRLMFLARALSWSAARVRLLSAGPSLPLSRFDETGWGSLARWTDAGVGSGGSE